MKLQVGGMHLSGSGYPNAARTLALLQQQLGVEIDERGAWLPDDFHLWRLAKGPRLYAGLQLMKLLVCNAVSLVRVLHAQCTCKAPVYVPYPSIFFLWLLSWLPRRWRPFCIADAYISVWDALFNDRRRNVDSIVAKMVLAAESRALRATSVVLVDTEANRSFYIEHFGLSPARIRSIPLAIDAAPFIERRAEIPKGNKIRVLFVGTMIPLHGIDKILGAARLLRHRADIEFRLVGDGQTADDVERMREAGTGDNIAWLRDWVSLDTVAAEVADAHICLGVFGGSDKAARVLPFKLYYALAGGRAIVTQQQLSMPTGAPAPPVCSTRSPDPVLVAQAIARLASDHGERNRLAAAGATFYDQWLSARSLTAEWKDILDEAPIKHS